jgi:hypothetical protein
VFAHCNGIDSLEGIVCSLYGIIQEPWTDNQTTLTQTKILRIDEKGV